MNWTEFALLAPLMFGAGDYNTSEYPMFLLKVSMHSPNRIELVKAFPHSAFTHSEDDGPEFNGGTGKGSLIFDISKYESSLQIPTLVRTGNKGNKGNVYSFSTESFLGKLREGFALPLDADLKRLEALHSVEVPDEIAIADGVQDDRWVTLAKASSLPSLNQVFFLLFAPNPDSGRKTLDALDKKDKDYFKRFMDLTYFVRPISVSLYLNNPKLGKAEQPLGSIEGWCVGKATFAKIPHGQFFVPEVPGNPMSNRPPPIAISDMILSGDSGSGNEQVTFVADAEAFIQTVVGPRLQDLAKDKIKTLSCLEMAEGDRRVSGGGCFFREVPIAGDKEGKKEKKYFIKGTLSAQNENPLSFRVLDPERRTDRYRVEIKLLPGPVPFEPVFVNSDEEEKK